MLTRDYDGVLLRDQALGSLRHLCWRWYHGIAVEKNSHLLQRVASCLWVEEVDRYAQKDKHDNEDEVVLPADTLQSNRVDESIKEDRNNGGRQSDDQTTGAQAVWPDFARIRSLKWCPDFPVSICIKARISAYELLHRDIIASKEDEKEWNDSDACCIAATHCEGT